MRYRERERTLDRWQTAAREQTVGSHAEANNHGDEVGGVDRKAVAFDVYAEVGGDSLTRMRWMLVATFR